MSLAPIEYSLVLCPSIGRRARNALAVVAASMRRSMILTFAAWLGLGASQAAEIVAPFVQHTYENPSANDPLLAAIFGQGWYAKHLALHQQYHVSGPLRPVATLATISHSPIAVYADLKLGACQHDFGEVRDVFPRIQRCPAKLLIKNGSTWTSRDIGSVCAIYNEDGEPGDKAFAAYDPEKKQVRFWAVLEGKPQPECDRTLTP